MNEGATRHRAWLQSVAELNLTRGLSSCRPKWDSRKDLSLLIISPLSPDEAFLPFL